ncbi:MAG: Lon protease [Pseudomonadota bacterium]|jgi:ATP-dependent Lon protease
MDRQQLPVIALRETVVLPGLTVPLGVGRPASLRALEIARQGGGLVFCVAQRENAEQPTFEQLYTMGTIARIVRVNPGPNGLSVIITGEQRATAIQFRERDGFAEAIVVPVEDMKPIDSDDPAFVGLWRELRERAYELGAVRGIPEQALREALEPVTEPGPFADRVTGYMDIPSGDKQILLETLGVEERLRRLLIHVQRQLGVVKAQQEIQSQVQEKLGERQREMYLREQLKAIKKELGDDDKEGEAEELEKRLEALVLPEKVRKEVKRELSRLERIGGEGMEAQVIRNYLEWISELPWNTRSEDKIELEHAKEMLSAEHYGLDDVKDRVLEFLAVRKLAAESAAAESVTQPAPESTDDTGTEPQLSEKQRADSAAAKSVAKGPILLFVGPPGVGKTSIAEGIAKALGREYVRIALGGVRDEADIRGHRRTYIGAMPGRIIQGLKQAGTKNPVFLLDEVDKLGASYQGDPSAALLEVLDPAQNHTFTDHYLNQAFDLSEVLFIATANFPQNIPAPLMDRMEVVEFSGYTEREKVAIAKQYLVPKKLAETGLLKRNIALSDEAIALVVREYTRESGVRQLSREVERVARKIARNVASNEEVTSPVTEEDIKRLLGRPRVRPERAAESDSVGVSTGMYYSPAGGDIMFVEASVRPVGASQTGGERSASPAALILTGQLGDVMKESARAALTYALRYGSEHGSRLASSPLEVHIHVPAGAIPKDGPSAGTAMATAMISALLDRPVRRSVAMTGEITLRGRVLPIGGVKEKVLGAHRAGITDVILPKFNMLDLEDVPEETRKALRFHFVDTLDEVLAVALVEPEVIEPVLSVVH